LTTECAIGLTVGVALHAVIVTAPKSQKKDATAFLFTDEWRLGYCVLNGLS